MHQQQTVSSNDLFSEIVAIYHGILQRRASKALSEGYKLASHYGNTFDTSEILSSHIWILRSVVWPTAQALIEFRHNPSSNQPALLKALNLGTDWDQRLIDTCHESLLAKAEVGEKRTTDLFRKTRLWLESLADIHNEFDLARGWTYARKDNKSDETTVRIEWTPACGPIMRFYTRELLLWHWIAESCDVSFDDSLLRKLMKQLSCLDEPNASASTTSDSTMHQTQAIWADRIERMHNFLKADLKRGKQSGRIRDNNELAISDVIEGEIYEAPDDSNAWRLHQMTEAINSLIVTGWESDNLEHTPNPHAFSWQLLLCFSWTLYTHVNRQAPPKQLTGRYDSYRHTVADRLDRLGFKFASEKDAQEAIEYFRDSRDKSQLFPDSFQKHVKRLAQEVVALAARDALCSAWISFDCAIDSLDEYIRTTQQAAHSNILDFASYYRGCLSNNEEINEEQELILHYLCVDVFSRECRSALREESDNILRIDTHPDRMIHRRPSYHSFSDPERWYLLRRLRESFDDLHQVCAQDELDVKSIAKEIQHFFTKTYSRNKGKNPGSVLKPKAWLDVAKRICDGTMANSEPHGAYIHVYHRITTSRGIAS